MAKNKISKDELKSPDAFMSFADKVGQKLSENWKLIAGALGVVVIAAVGYAASTAIHRAQEETASESLFQIEKKINQVRESHAEKQRASVEDLLDNQEKNQKKIEARLKEVPELNFEKDFSDLASQLENVIQQHKGTQSAQMSTLRLASLYMQYEKWEKAQNILQPLTQNAKKGTAIYGLSRTQLAAVYSRQGEHQKSIQLLNDILIDKELSYLHSEALLKLGVLSQNQGENSRAEEMFRRLTTEFAETEAGKIAKNLLKLLRLTNPKTETNPTKASSVDL